MIQIWPGNKYSAARLRHTHSVHQFSLHQRINMTITLTHLCTFPPVIKHHVILGRSALYRFPALHSHRNMAHHKLSVQEEGAKLVLQEYLTKRHCRSPNCTKTKSYHLQGQWRSHLHDISLNSAMAPPPPYEREL